MSMQISSSILGLGLGLGLGSEVSGLGLGLSFGGQVSGLGHVGKVSLTSLRNMQLLSL